MFVFRYDEAPVPDLYDWIHDIARLQGIEDLGFICRSHVARRLCLLVQRSDGIVIMNPISDQISNLLYGGLLTHSTPGVILL